MRSTALLRTTPTQCQPSFRHAMKGNGRYLSTTPSLSFPSKPARPPPASPFTFPNWSDNNRGNISDIRTPQSASYDLAFGQAEKKEGKDGEQADEYQDVIGDALLNLSITDISTTKQPVLIPSAQRPTMRLVPRTGRTVHVRSNVDVARSFKLLSIQIATNKCRQDFYSQRFHERPGLKRKRLKSERWQRRFKKGFKATVSRVRELTAQGW